MMIQDFRHYADGADLDADICVIGAGAAGIALTREFIGSRTRVLLLESGGFEREDGTNLLNRGESVGLSLPGLHEGRGRVFGGTTRLWDAQCIRLDDIDFQTRSWVPHSGWPIRKTDINPYYTRAEALLGISGRIPDERVWQEFGVRTPGFDGGKLSRKFSTFGPRPDLGKLYRKEFERSSNVQVLLHANATKIHANKHASAVDLRTLEGKTGRVTARAFVLCGGGIENARLLLLSDGLGNRHDLVGRFFQEHPKAYSAVLEGDTPDMLRDLYGHLYKGGLLYLPKIPLGAEVQQEQQVLNCVADLEYAYDPASGVGAARDIYRSLKELRRPKELGRGFYRIARDLDKVASTAYRRYAQGKLATSPSLAWLKLFLEQSPNPLSRVSLSRERDALGLNQARVDWRLTDLDRRTAQIMTGTVDAEFRRLGLARLRVADWLDGEDWASNFDEACHHMGTTRMADDPKKGVVDGDCQVHGVAGLYIGGSSVFPTSGYANPTLTIVALALRLADHLKVR